MSSNVKAAPGARRKPVKASALAQQLGLAPVPVPKLTSSQWTEVRLRAQARGDTSHTESCPICTEEFKGSEQVLLSCSHVFHKICLRNFELFSGNKVCPICRSKEYEKRVIHEAASAYRHACATKIQALFRRWRVRKQYLLMLSLIPPKDLSKRRDFFMSKLGATSTRLAEMMNVRERALDALFEEMDRSVHSVRQSLRAAEVQLKVFSAQEWTDIRRRAQLRAETDCPICAEPLAGGDYKKRAVLLSCSHVFHHGCLLSFERFTIASSALDGAEKSSWSTQQSMLDEACNEDGEMQLFQPPPACLCPLCRSNYQKAWLDRL